MMSVPVVIFQNQMKGERNLLYFLEFFFVRTGILFPIAILKRSTAGNSDTTNSPTALLPYTGHFPRVGFVLLKVGSILAPEDIARAL